MQSRPPSSIHRFLHWWGTELRELVPDRTLLSRRAQARRLVIAVDGPLRLLLEKAGRAEILAQADPESGDVGLMELGRLIKARPELPVGLRFGPQDCFARTLELPAQAEADFGRILDLDMERTTPFRSAEVRTAFCIAPDVTPPHGKRAVRHLIIKRRTIDPLVEKLRDLGIEPAFADCWSEDRRTGLPINLLADTAREGRWAGHGFTPVLAALFAVLAVGAAATPIVRHQNALDALNARTSAARTEATAVRQTVEASQAASAQIAAIGRMVKARLPLARIMEELTAIMPDSAWVSDLRIDGNTVEFTGFAKSAASLVAPLENSPLFTGVSLTSPVVFDSAEDKERFSMRLSLDGGASPGTDAEADGAEQGQNGTVR
jgi:general secretion pathway protein L